MPTWCLTRETLHDMSAFIDAPCYWKNLHHRHECLFKPADGCWAVRPKSWLYKQLYKIKRWCFVSSLIWMESTSWIMISSVQALFWLSMYIKNQNSKIWSDKNFHFLQETPLVNIWECGVLFHITEWTCLQEMSWQKHIPGFNSAVYCTACQCWMFLLVSARLGTL